ncbi:hypothetical protein [Vibrio splendidus]|nr:hypothetical protein [Vibrio splendidus]
MNATKQRAVVMEEVSGKNGTKSATGKMITIEMELIMKMEKD